MTSEDNFDPSELKGVVIRNHEKDFLASIAKLKKIQMSDNYSHEIESFEVDETGHILLDLQDPNHLEWMKEDE